MSESPDILILEADVNGQLNFVVSNYGLNNDVSAAFVCFCLVIN